MTTTSTTETTFRSSGYTQDNPIHHIISPILPQFDRVVQSYAIFNLLFLTIGCVEFGFLLIFFTFLAKSALLAFSLAVVFLTFFSYFILRLYLQTQKPAQFQELKERFLTACKGVMGYKEGHQGHHQALATACTRFSDALQGRENSFYKLPTWMSFLDPYVEKFSYWYHWNDVHKMRELLLLTAIQENIKLVKSEPTNPKTHTALANAYVTLSSLYVSIRHNNKSRWLNDDPFIQSLERKYRSTAERAIEEFKILCDLSPNDLWVHAQLAKSYHDLKMPLEEIKEYEIMLTLSPHDPDILLKAGTLYFEQGLNGKGLHIYEQLKNSDSQKAEELIRYYGAYQGM